MLNSLFNGLVEGVVYMPRTKAWTMSSDLYYFVLGILVHYLTLC